MVAREELGIAGGGEGDGGGGATWELNGVVLGGLVVVVVIAAIATTVTLRWTAFVAWPVGVGVGVLALRRARDRRPQVAWVEGTVLVVQDSRGVRRCDLADVREAWLTYTAGLRTDPSFRVLVVRGEGSAVRYVLRDRGGRPLAAPDLRRLAAALDASPAGEEVARELREIIEYGRVLTSSERVDWGHRRGGQR